MTSSLVGTEMCIRDRLIYGAALIANMILRPQGLVPNVRRTRELLESEVEQDAWVAATSTDATAEPVAGSSG
jgi:hypothetical protein